MAAEAQPQPLPQVPGQEGPGNGGDGDAEALLNDDEGAFQLFVHHPHECCVLYRRMITLGIWPTLMLVFHNAYLVATDLAECPNGDCKGRIRFWYYWCMFRLVMVIPRPYWWLRAMKEYTNAMNALTPEDMTRRLIRTQRTWWVWLNHQFGTLFTFWLIVSLVLCYFDVFPCTFSRHFWGHCLLNLANQLFQRLISVMMLLYLTTSNMRRGIPEAVLHAHSRVVVFEDEKQGKRELGERDLECSICFGEYCAGQHIRQLNCSHHYHKNCVDPWLVEQKNRCPLCNYTVGSSQR
mmetsp:Transcript_20925/g.51263  ORF Transcript_20925/g.51263 Transcript_20925/m.51263 type:complete len:293 (-) Transcript_20925:334-1212(-)